MMIPTQTLTRFINAQQRKLPHASGELSDLISAVALGVKMIGNLVNTAGLKDLYGYTGKENVQGEQTQKLDMQSDEILIELLSSSGHFGLMVSEERDLVISSEIGKDEAKYVVAFDPLDGSSNLGFGVPVGTIFTIYRKIVQNRAACSDDFLQTGRHVVAAGYALYGSSTIFVYSSGQGVHEFTLDTSIGEFMLTQELVKMPKQGKIYSTNEGNSAGWDSRTKSYIEKLKSEKYSARYIGSLVADFHRTLKKGGIFLYPADAKNLRGKLRLLYECVPIAYIAEQAGGAASDGKIKVLDILPCDIHERCPLIVGSLDCVNDYMN